MAAAPRAADQPLPTRIGGFGGRMGLRHIRREGITM